MGGFPPPPPEALAAAEQACGGTIELTPITDRRGSAVWRANGPAAAAAIKLGYGEGTETTTREAAVLDMLDGYTAQYDTHPGGCWMVTPWIGGPSTWDAFAAPRQDGSGLDQALAAGVELCRAVADLHASGWIHSDLQPSHGIHTVTGVRLLDLSWAWRRGFEPPVSFRGGITHLVAPELAASINVGIQPVAPSPAAEVYALAGTLWTCITGQWPLDYTAAGIDPGQLTPAELRTHIANRRVPLHAADTWPALQRPLREILLAKHRDRPTAAELADILAEP